MLQVVATSTSSSPPEATKEAYFAQNGEIRGWESQKLIFLLVALIWTRYDNAKMSCVEEEDYQVQADVFQHEHSCRGKQDGENDEHLKIMKNIYVCEILGVHRSFWCANWRVFWIKSDSLKTTFLKAGKPMMRNICIINSDDFKQTQVGSRRYLDGMVGISPIVGRLSILLFFFFCSSAPGIVFRMSTNVKQLWLDEGNTGDNNVSCVVQCMITVNMIRLSH